MAAHEYLVNASNINTTIFPYIIKTSNTIQPTSFTSNTELATGIRYSYATLQFCILILAVLGNATLILLVCFYRKLCTTTNIFIANLAVGDILLALAVMPFDIDRLLRGYFAYSAMVCELSSTIFFLSLPASAINLLIMTFERFCAVRFPLRHRSGSMFTRRRMIAILLCSWAYTATTASLPIMGWRSFPTQVYAGECLFFFEKEYAVFLLVANFFIPLLLIIIMNVWILQIAKYRMIRRSDSQCQRSVNLLSRSASVASSASTKAAKSKTTKIIAILVGVFASCWLPYIINTSVNIICNGCSFREIGLTVMSLVFMNSAINPVLYGIYKPQIRKALKDVLTRAGRRLLVTKTEENLAADRDVEETCF